MNTVCYGCGKELNLETDRWYRVEAWHFCTNCFLQGTYDEYHDPRCPICQSLAEHLLNIHHQKEAFYGTF